MPPSSDELDELDQPVDDTQLTIRIPNPSVYLARNSQWTGRRGKPRCDHCRLSNLKCDRVLPVCNHCSWTPGRECKYTPLPTPAHRGIPRCDRCRTKNIKCDRNLPICNHCAADNQGPCNYTPKRRHKLTSDYNTSQEPYSGQSLSFLPVDSTQNPNKADFNEFYGHNIASSSLSAPPIARTSADPSIDLQGNDRFSIHNNRTSSSHPKQRRSRSNFVPHPLSAQQISYIVPFDPWSHPSFPPLPQSVLNRLSTLNAAEMPTRENFDEALAAFLADLIPQLRETAAFSPEAYKAVADSLTNHKVSAMSEHIRTWATCHRARSGSTKYCLILLPVDEVFRYSAEQADRLGDNYIARVDAKTSDQDPWLTDRRLTEEPMPSATEEIISDELDAFDRMPVQNQIYDVLAFTHAGHGNAFSMLAEVRKLHVAGITLPMAEIFVHLCPLCDNAS